MASRSTEQNLYCKFSTKIKLIAADIWFLKSCKSFSIFPKFINVKIPKQSPITGKIEFFAKQKWLDLEIKNLYGKRSLLEIEAYGLFKKLTYKLNNVEFEQWIDFQRKMFVVIEAKFLKKMFSLKKKLKNLKPQKRISAETQNIIENLSSQSFDKKEITLLNKGLKFALPPIKNSLLDIVGNIESSIQYVPDTLPRDSLERPAEIKSQKILLTIRQRVFLAKIIKLSKD